MAPRKWTEDEIDLAAARLEKRQEGVSALESAIGEQIILYGERSKVLQGRLFKLLAEKEKILVEKVKDGEAAAR